MPWHIAASSHSAADAKTAWIILDFAEEGGGRKQIPLHIEINKFYLKFCCHTFTATDI